MKIFRITLFWLARLAGLIGLIAGGKALGKYVKAMFTDAEFDSFSYNDLVFFGSVLTLLSFLVLVFVEVAQILDRGFRLRQPEGAGAPAKAAGVSSDAQMPPSSSTAEAASPAEAGDKSVDEKLARLVK